MPQVILTNGYFYKFDQKQWRTAQPYPPLGTLIVAACLEREKIPFQFHDNSLCNDLTAIEKLIRTDPADFLVIYDDGFNYLSKMCLSTMREAAFKISQWAKDEGKGTIICSSDATDRYELYHNAGFDYILHGEGEETLLELMEYLSQGRNLEEVNGLSFCENKTIIKNKPRAIIHDLDSLPLPAWNLVNVKSYREIWLNRYNYHALNIATTRGCPFKCNWCAKPIYGNRYHSRSVSKVVDEIALLQNDYGVNYFWFCDDIFGLKPGWITEFRNEIRSRNLKIQFKIQSRADILLKNNIVKELIESGLDIAWIGAESGSQRILDAMDKGITVAQIEQVTREIQALNSRVGFFLQFGYLGEERTDIKKTIRMVLKLMPDEIGVSVSYPLPGTVFYDKVRALIGDKKNWVDSDDLDLMFRNGYSNKYYRNLHRYIHYRFQIKKRFQNLVRVFSVRKSGFRQVYLNLIKLILITPMIIYVFLKMEWHGRSRIRI